MQEIGLTPGETKVYLALISLGATKTGLLAKKAEVSSSKVYKILDRLTQKGLVGHVIKGKIKYFQALEPKRVLDYLDKREQELQEKRSLVEKILPQLELEQKLSGKKSEAVVYDGFKAVTNFFRSILDELKSGETYYVLGASYGDTPALRPFFQNYHSERNRKGIKVKMLANMQVKNNIEPATRKNSEIRFLPEYLMNKLEIVFFKNKVFLVLFTQEPIGFLIQNEEAVKAFAMYFETLWKIAPTI